MGRYARLVGYLQPYRRLFAGSLLATVVASVLDGFTFALLIPLLRLVFEVGSALPSVPTPVERVVGFVTGGLIANAGPAAALRNVVLLILAAIAVKNVSAFAAAYFSAYVQEGVIRDFRRDLFAHLQRLSLAFHRRTKSGHLVGRMLADVDQASLFFNQMLQSVVRHGVLILVYLAMLFALSWRLTLVTMVVAPAIAAGLKPILRRIRVLFAEAVRVRGDLTAQLVETLRGAKEVKIYVAEEFETRRFGEALARYLRSMLRAHRLSALASPLSETLAAGAFVLLLLTGVWVSLDGTAVRPELVIAYLVVALRLLSPVKHVAQFPSFAEQALAGADRVFEVLDHPPDDVDSPQAARFPGLERTIEFRNVWFAYRDDDWVLKGVDLTVHRGEVVALVGHSGAGKSTLVDLLPRFIDPTRGAVLLDGVPTTKYSRRSLRQAFGVVSQETIIFNDSVVANIAYGEPVDREAVIAAARAANAHEFIMELPRGYETRLGERGTMLSGGQRQRIAVARALLRDPPLLILDEATSALDATAERLVQEAVARLMENRTVLIVAHRLSTVLRADVIAVLDGGRIVEVGRHEDLVRAGGRYHELHEVELASRGA